MKKVIVASANPVKLKSTEIGFTKMFPGETFIIRGVTAPSEASDVHMSDGEMLKGATNRANNVARLEPEADYWVGIEGGLQLIGGELSAFAWAVVKSKDGVFFPTSKSDRTYKARKRTRGSRRYCIRNKQLQAGEGTIEQLISVRGGHPCFTRGTCQPDGGD